MSGENARRESRKGDRKESKEKRVLTEVQMKAKEEVLKGTSQKDREDPRPGTGTEEETRSGMREETQKARPKEVRVGRLMTPRSGTLTETQVGTTEETKPGAEKVVQTGVRSVSTARARKVVRKEKARKARTLPWKLGSSREKTARRDVTAAAKQATSGPTVGKD